LYSENAAYVPKIQDLRGIAVLWCTIYQ
jgi:hypothetical protein